MTGDNDDKRLKVTEQLNAALRKQQHLLESTTRELNSQLEIFQKMHAAISAAGDKEALKYAKDAKHAFNDMADETARSVSAVTQLRNRLEDANESIDNLLKTVKRLGKEFPVLTTTVLATSHGVIEGFRGAFAVSNMVLKTVTNLIGGMTKLGIAILAIPFKIFQNLVEKAEAGGGGNELAQAYENVRKQFGDFRQDAAHNVLETAHTIDKEFTETGLNTWRVFGNLAERINLVHEVAEKMGATFDVVGGEIAEHAGHILAYQKGLGVATDNMKDFAQAAISLGKPVQEVFRETASLSIAMQKQFGGSAKLYSRDMSKMINDVKHFGGVSQKVMVETAVYTRKLGIETDKLLASLDKFDTFESAAESAAKLAQTYGVQIDAFKLMAAESPAEQADMIKQAFREQGIAVENLDRKNLKYISSLTGWDEATSRALLSSKNLGTSLDDIREGSVKAEKQQLSQAEAMRELAGAIERLTPSGGSGFGGFIKALIKGFDDGIQWSKEFRAIMINIRQDMWKMYWAGRQIGTEFVKAFPGVKDFFGGIAELFAPKKFQELVDGVVAVFKKFFAALSTDPKTALPELMKDLHKKFFDFFDSSKPASGKIVEGARKFLDAMKHIFAGSIKFILESLRDGFRLITDIMSGKGLAEAKSGGGAVIKFVMDMFEPTLQAIKDVWPSLKDAFITMIETAWEKIKASGIIERVWDYAKKYIVGVAKVSLGVGLLKGGVTALGGVLVKYAVVPVIQSLAAGLLGLIRAKAVERATQSVAGGAGGAVLERAASALGSSPAKNVGKMGEATEALDKVSKTPTNWGNVTKFLVGFAGMLAIGFVALGVAIMLMDKMNLKEEEMKKGLLLVAGIGTAMIPAAGATLLLSKVKIADPKSMAIGMAAMTLGVVAMLGAAGAMYAIFTSLKVDIAKFQQFGKALFTMSKVFAVMGVVVLESMAVGAAVVMTKGVGAGMAIAGFGAIATAVEAMSGTAISIMRSLDKITFGAELQAKVDMFVSILNSITGFAKVFSDIMDNMRPSIVEALKGESTSENIDRLTKFVGELIGKPGAGGITALVEHLSNVVKDFASGGDKVLAAGKIFAELFGAITGLAQGLNPPKELFDACDGLGAIKNDVSTALFNAGQYIIVSNNELKKLMEHMNQTVAGFAGMDISADDIKKVSAVSEFYKSIVPMLSALKPDVALVRAATDADGKTDSAVMNSINDMIAQKGTAISKIMRTLAPTVKTITESLGEVSANGLQAMKVVGPVLSNMFTMVTGIITSFSTVLTADKNVLNTDLNGKSGLITRMISSVSDVMSGLGEQMPSLTASMLKIAQGADAKVKSEVKTSLQIVSDMVKVLNELTTTLSDQNIMKINVGGKLTELSKRVGLGGEARYEIQHKPITITVNLSVQMDAKDIEYGIINRNGPNGKVVVMYDQEARKNNV